MIIQKEANPVAVAKVPLTRRNFRERLQKQQTQETGTDPFALARAFLDVEGRDGLQQITVRFWRAEWYRYLDGRYVRVSDGEMNVELTGFIKGYFDENSVADRYGNVQRVRKALVANTLNALAAIVAVTDATEMPAWLGDDNQGPFLGLTNGLLELGTLAARVPRVLETSPLWFSTVALPVAFEPDAKCERWLAFLKEVMEGDTERIELIQEFAGYLLVPETNQHKFVVAVGEGANGKSVLLDLLTALLGPENVAHVPLEVFGQRFQLTATLGKLANICAEVGDIDRVAEGFLKQFTAGDRMYFDRKNLAGVHAYPTARLILSTNNRPKFRDRSAGLWRRMIVIPFGVTIPPERQDRLLKAKLKQELPGILLWALSGLRRLQQRERFVTPTVCAEALADYRQESNPARVFLDDNCEAHSESSVGCSELYQLYQKWSKQNGFDTLDARQFGKEVRKAFPNVERIRAGAGDREWTYEGVSYVPSVP